jgi:[ribosomal protein S18]-alanine N-acetyltransferase
VSLSGVRVRAAGAGDLAGVIALERGAAEAPHWAEADYAAMLNEGDAGVRRCLFVAEAAGELIGFAVGKVVGGESSAELESVAVGVDARRRGVGKTLCGAVADWCREQGAAALELEVRAASVGAIALYAGMGFAPVGRRRAYYREPVDDALLMRLDLA